MKRSELGEEARRSGADAQQNKCRSRSYRVCVVWKIIMQQGRCGHLIGERQECAHSGDAKDSVVEAHSSALPRLVVEVLEGSKRCAHLRSMGDHLQVSQVQP